MKITSILIAKWYHTNYKNEFGSISDYIEYIQTDYLPNYELNDDEIHEIVQAIINHEDK